MVIQVPNYFGRPGAGDTIFRVLDELAPQVKAPGSGCSLHQICRLTCNPENSYFYKRYPDEASLAAHLTPSLQTNYKPILGTSPEHALFPCSGLIVVWCPGDYFPINF